MTGAGPRVGAKKRLWGEQGLPFCAPTGAGADPWYQNILWSQEEGGASQLLKADGQVVELPPPQPGVGDDLKKTREGVSEMPSPRRSFVRPPPSHTDLI